jgi:hypothetical integral membrane protein (TIGR02206 family)
MAQFETFGVVHLAILTAIPFSAWRLSRPGGRTLARGLGVALGANEIGWYSYRLATEGLRLDGLPLNLCDLTLWLTVAAALGGPAAIFEVAYYGGAGGSSMALLTPDLWEPRTAYETAHYFVSHGGVVVTLLVLLWSGWRRPRSDSAWRAFRILNIFAAGVGLFNAMFETNYLYLCEKPRNASLLDYMGPWPWYVIAGEVAAGLIFALLWLPYRKSIPARGESGGSVAPPAVSP